MIRPKNIEDGRDEAEQLYDLSEDIGQIRNLAKDQPERTQAMKERIQAIRAGTATRPNEETLAPFARVSSFHRLYQKLFE